MVKHDRNMQMLQIEKIYTICAFCGFSLAIMEEQCSFVCSRPHGEDSGHSALIPTKIRCTPAAIVFRTLELPIL